MAVFGAGKLPDVAKSLGQGVKEFRNEANDAVGSSTTASASGAAATGTAATASTVPGSPTTVVESDNLIDDGVAAAEPRDTRADQV